MPPIRIKRSTLAWLVVVFGVHAAPAPTAIGYLPPPVPAVPYASDNPNFQTYPQNAAISDPQPVRGPLGAPIMSTPNIPLELENPSLLSPPTTDHGNM